MSVTVQQILGLLQTLAPSELACSWDNVGLLVDAGVPVSRVLTTLDITAAVVQEAVENNCQLIVSHHPVIFDPLKHISAGDVPALLIKNNISAICMHTNLDAAPGGVNDTLADLLGMQREGRRNFAEDCGRVGPVEPTTVQQLARFLKNPVKTFFRARLDVVFDEQQTHDDDEVFSLDPLDRYALRDRLIDDPQAVTSDDAQAVLARRAQRELGSGVLPMRHLGERVAASLVRDVQPALACWQTLAQAYPEAVDKLRLNLGLLGLQIDDWLESLRSGGREKVWIELSASTLCDDRGQARADRLVEAWVRQIVASSCGHSVGGVLVGLDARIEVPPLGKDEATGHLLALLQAWHDGMREPLPFTARTALADLKDGKGQQAYDGGFNNAPEVQEPCLAWMFPDYAALAADGRLAAYTATLFKPLFDWAHQATVFVHDTNVGDGDTP